MKLTLDHNVVIDIVLGSPRVTFLCDALRAHSHQPHIVEIGASELRQRGVKPDRYDLFEQLLTQAGLGDLPRLAPMAIFDVTFWDHALLCDDEMKSQAKQIVRAERWRKAGRAKSRMMGNAASSNEYQSRPVKDFDRLLAY